MKMQVSECFGYFLVYEARVVSVLAARDRFLKPGGLMSALALEVEQRRGHEKKFGTVSCSVENIGSGSG